MQNLNRRSLITGLISFVAAPAIVRVANIMPIKVVDPYEEIFVRYLDTYFPVLNANPFWTKVSYDEVGNIFEIKFEIKDIYI